MKMSISELDKYWFYCVVQFSRDNQLNQAAKRFSVTGDGHFYVYISVALLFFHPHGQHFFNLVLGSFIVEFPLYLLLKNSIRRHRPCHALAGFNSGFEPSDKFSLPSGHTAGAFVFASVVNVVFPVLAPIAFAWACFVGLSRIALGVHYPLDILAGAALGMGAVILVVQLMQ
ncbi:phosphatase PAP2 family protein [Shewanella basaltis]|uniref:phosphatase PAP2 family protein n=1 Tax=Shewanella basaltis TaxID=472183 RepID=UPI0020101F92|nr:phosphatase PAP2 family protein [Shewanella basaltis]MCL1113393.1 phosphatase PAP2 family protein [Shewanella basaltis]